MHNGPKIEQIGFQFPISSEFKTDLAFVLLHECCILQEIKGFASQYLRLLLLFSK